MHPENYQKLLASLREKNVSLVAVSKMQSAESIRKLYSLGHRDFGENYVQELLAKQKELPAEIRWHYIGHLQSNKVKFIASFVHLIHGVDSARLLKEINKQGEKTGRTIPVLLQVHIANEETKFGFDEAALQETMILVRNGAYAHTVVRGLMGMASFTDNQAQVKKEFVLLRKLYEQHFQEEIREGTGILSMGMSGDYELAVEEGSNMVRIGSLIFGSRR